MAHKQDPAFPTIAEILAMAHQYVSESYGGAWPESDWLSFSPEWALNLCIDDETHEQLVIAYPVHSDGHLKGTLDTMAGIRIPVNAGQGN
jgi:hypothetical protein